MVLVYKLYSAQIVRSSLVFLDVWQTYALYVNRHVIDILVGPGVPTYAYMTPFILLSILSIVSFFSLSRILMLIFLGANVLEFMFLTFAAAVYSTNQSPLFGVGLFAFITLVCLGAFLRVLIYEVEQSTYTVRETSKWTTQP